MIPLLILIFLNNVLSLSVVDISSVVFGNDRKALPFAFGDFNSDELTDVFVVRDEGRRFEILLANEKEPLLVSSPGMKCNFTEYKVTSVVPGDFDGDAFMDILITTQDIESNRTSLIHDVRIIWGGEDKLNCSFEDLPTVVTVQGHPLAMDYNQDMIIDLFGTSIDGKNVFWVFNHNRTIDPEMIPLNNSHNHEVRLPHSHSYLDFDGDFISDLLVTTTSSIEIWLGSEDSGFYYSGNKINLPIGVPGHIGQSLYVDVNLIGILYLLLPICYDKQCENSSVILHDGDDWLKLSISFEDEAQVLWGFIPPDSELYTDTITLRSGDYNMDGYPDLLVTLKQVKGTQKQTFLMENVPCTENCKFSRTYQIQWRALAPFGNGAVLAVFYDFYQDGVLDFILVRKNETTDEHTVGAYKLSLEYDANFMKVMVLTGLKNKKIPMTVGVLGKKKGTYGTNLPGPIISYHMLTQDGLPREGISAQLAQSAYNVLNLPFTIFGLDRTPNFVDTLTVGISHHYKTWNQLIPNSQVVVIPSPPDDPSSWKAQLFVTPSKIILKSVFVFTGICGGLVILVIFLHYKERRDDRIESLLSDNSQESDVIS